MPRCGGGSSGQVRRAASPPGAVCHTYKRVDATGVERILKGGAKGVTHLLRLFLRVKIYEQCSTVDVISEGSLLL